MMEAAKSHALDLARIRQIASLEEFEWKVYYAALEYIECGMYVIPVEPNGKALPRKSEGHSISYSNATKNKVVVDKWFNPSKGGKFVGYNIGIACGKEGGVFVIDVDRHGSDDGFATLKQLENEHGVLPVGPCQVTPNGGMHYFFRWQEGAASSTSKMGPGIDTRGGEATACKSHVVAWPSVINGVEYKWEYGGPLPRIPGWALEKLGIPWRRPPRPAFATGEGRGNENVALDDLEQKVPEEQLSRMLDEIDPDELTYDEWLRVGMAIKSQYPGEDGLAFWDNWSKKGYRYKQDECQIRWGGFDEFGAVRIGTLFWIAKQQGWQPQKGDVTLNPIHECIEEMNSKYALTVVGGKVKIIRERDRRSAHSDKEAHLSSYDLLDKQAFESVTGNWKVVVDEETGKDIPVCKIWLASGARRTYPNGIGLFPDGAPPGYYNTWEGFSVLPKKGDCSLFLDHIKKVICNNREEEYEWVLDWLADLVQDPANPKGTAIVMRGDEGVGKGTLANTIGSLFCGHYLHLIDDSHLLSNFNAFLMDAILVFADEITWGGNKKTAGKLKGLVTERHLVAERKGVDAQSFRNLTHLMIASNSSWVIPAGMNSRRWYVTDVPSYYRGNIKYFGAIQRELKRGGREALLYFLLNRNIKNDLRTVPETEALHDQRQRSIDDTALNFMIEAIIKGRLATPDISDELSGDWPSLVEKGHLYDEYCEWCKSRQHRPEHVTTFYKTMSALGLKSARPRVRGNRVYAVKVPPVGALIETLKSTYNIDIESNFQGEDDDE